MELTQLEQQKNMLVGQLNEIQKKIDDYGLLDIAYDSGPFKDLINDRTRVENKIKSIKKLLDS